MSAMNERPRQRYRFDPLNNGVVLGLGHVRLAIVFVIVATGAGLMFFGGKVVLGSLVVLIGPLPVVWSYEGLPGLLWLAMRAHYLITPPERRVWSIDPELVPHEDAVLTRDGAGALAPSTTPSKHEGPSS